MTAGFAKENTHLMAKQLVHNSHYFFRSQLPHDVVFVLQGLRVVLPRPEVPTVHL
jgi:hypothetical protein